MKKLLICLLGFIIILASFNIFYKENEVNNNQNNAFVAETSTPSISHEHVIKEIDYAPIDVDNTSNFATSWSTMSTDGYLELTAGYNQMSVLVTSLGTNLDSNQLYRDGIPFLTNEQYEITFDISSTVDRKVVVALINADNNQVLSTTEIFVNAESKPQTITYTHGQESIWNGRLSFYLGNDGSAIEQTVVINNLRINNISSNDGTIKINHLGYLEADQKRCVFPYNQGDLFDVRNADTNEIVYTGAIVKETVNPLTNETNYYGDFTNVTTPGRYYIESQIGGKSYQFIISDEVYDNLQISLLKGISIQRCGIELPQDKYGDHAHKACHTSDASVFGTEEKVNVSGGWHDAGDFGRYVKTGTKALNDLLLAYLGNPEAFNDDSMIIESGNGIADVLDEARYELEWLIKMQLPWGEVYSKAVTPNLPGQISPDADNQPLYVLPSETAVVGDYSATMALAYIVYKDIDKEFAEMCLEKSKLSWTSLKDTAEMVEHTNPPEINAGEYRDDKDIDERFFASMALWAATKEESYYDYAIEQFNKGDINGNGYTNVGAYGKYIFLIQDEAENMENYDEIYDSFIKEAEGILNAALSDGYNTSIYSYEWGSNGTIADNGNLLMMAYDISKDHAYRQMAVEQLNYLLGKNSLNMSFVSGYGYNSPKNVHHRLSEFKNITLNGVLVGGPNNSREDTITSQIGADVPPAKVYADNYESYSTNEMSIYWNASLIHLISSLR